MHNPSPVESVYYAYIKTMTTKGQVLILRMCLYIGMKYGFLVTSTNELVKSKYTKVGREL